MNAVDLVVDCDSHVMEPPDLWQRYLEPRFRSRAIRIVVEDGVEKLIIGEKVVLSERLAGLGGAHIPRERLLAGGLRYVDGCPRGSWDPLERRELLDAWGVDLGVLFPTIGILPFPTEDMALASAYCRAYNTWQAEFHEAARDRVLPIAIVNWLDVAAAARELDRCLAMKPSDYFRRNLWFVAEPEERTIGSVLDLVGPERVLWGSDFPHVDSTLRAPELIRESVAGLDPEARRRVLGENARRLFAL